MIHNLTIDIDDWTVEEFSYFVDSLDSMCQLYQDLSPDTKAYIYLTLKERERDLKEQLELEKGSN